MGRIFTRRYPLDERLGFKAMLGIFKNEYMVEAYGKLPFYKDYINVITSVEAGIWQEWLLNVFSIKNTLIPSGMWHFLFIPGKGMHPVTGIIMQGSDGRRNFPFSLFVTLGRTNIKNRMKWAELFAIKDQLTRVYQYIYTAPDIDTCYATLSGLAFEIRKKEIRSSYLKDVNRPDLKRFTHGTAHDFPNFSIISQGGIACLSMGRPSGTQVISEWETLMFTPEMRISN